MAKITYGDKKALDENIGIANNNKVTDKDMNEIKNSVNALYDIIMEKIYGIGDLYFSTNSENPETKLGFGKWVEWGKGKVPVGVDISQEEFDTVEKTGGEKTHTQTIDELATHDHKIVAKSIGGSGTIKVNSGATYSVPNPVGDIKIGETGENKPMNILQPYITCYIWKRVS